jgi:tetratricopeptide (TPR) repeat protein
MRSYDVAIDHFRGALAIREKILGPEDRSVALTLESLGRRSTTRRAPRRSRSSSARSRSGRRSASGHPQIATTLASLALCARDSGRPAEARPLLERALSISETALGPSHPDTARCRMQLATVLSRLGARDEALHQALQAEEAERDHLRRTAAVVPERLALSLGELHAKGLALAVGAAAVAGGTTARSALDAVVRSRALVLDEVASRNRYLRERAEPSLAPLHDALDYARERLSGLSVRGRQEVAGTYHAQLEPPGPRRTTRRRLWRRRASRSGNRQPRRHRRRCRERRASRGLGPGRVRAVAPRSVGEGRLGRGPLLRRIRPPGGRGRLPS